MKKDFNRDSHPERQDDEVWITNTDNQRELIPLDEDMSGSGWDSIGWKSKRAGNIAYDNKGVPLGGSWRGAFPVFVKQEEIRKKDAKILEGLLPRKN